MTDSKLVALTTDIVSSYLEKNAVSAGDLEGLIVKVHAALSATDAPAVEETPASRSLTPAQVRKSITPDFLTSFEDGKGYKSLKRHLASRGLTFADYKAKWGLPKDYPSTAPAYSAKRSELAKKAGLGTGGRGAPPKKAKK